MAALWWIQVGLEDGEVTVADKYWDPKFCPSYTPEQMLKAGVFEGKYINAVKGVPAAWKQFPKVLGPNDEPDPKLNKFGVKSRQPLSVWRSNGWIRTDKMGWFEWYIKYYNGRRLGKEDDWQIGRWRSFVARHQGQIVASGQTKDETKRIVQRQGLLQWAWDSREPFTEERCEKNLINILRATGCKRKPEDSKEDKVSNESLLVLPKSTQW